MFRERRDVFSPGLFSFWLGLTLFLGLLRDADVRDINIYIYIYIYTFEPLLKPNSSTFFDETFIKSQCKHSWSSLDLPLRFSINLY